MKINAELMALTACHIRDGGSGWIYLAAPYTHPDYVVRCARYEAINVTFRELVTAGLRVFSPITLTHPITDPDDPSEIWWGFDDPWLRGACAIAVLTLDDWEHSKGVAHEIKIAKDMKKPLIYLADSAREIYEIGVNLHGVYLHGFAELIPQRRRSW